MTHNILVLPGDGIGPEITVEAVKVLNVFTEEGSLSLNIEYADLGGIGYDNSGHPYPEETRVLANKADAILLGAVGGPQYDTVNRDLRPEKGLLGLRADLGLFANLRPAVLFEELADASTLKPEVVSGLDMMIVRELTGGIYFGQPRGIETISSIDSSTERKGYNTLVYLESEIERIVRLGFETAMKRNKQLCSVDKANVLEVFELWRETVERISKEYPEVSVSHMYVDNAAMQLVKEPKQFDVIVTGNMFGDILSDAAAMLTGSIGMLPSASLNKDQKGMYEPIHGSAPDIAGQNTANPLAAILSVAMMLRYTLNENTLADRIENAVKVVLANGFRTADIYNTIGSCVSTEEMGNAVIEALKK